MLQKIKKKISKKWVFTKIHEKHVIYNNFYPKKWQNSLKNGYLKQGKAPPILTEVRKI
jgi:hypothetical protein